MLIFPKKKINNNNMKVFFTLNAIFFSSKFRKFSIDNDTFHPTIPLWA